MIISKENGIDVIVSNSESTSLSVSLPKGNYVYSKKAGELLLEKRNRKKGRWKHVGNIACEDGFAFCEIGEMSARIDSKFRPICVVSIYEKRFLWFRFAMKVIVV